MELKKKLQVLIEMRPALDGFAGIPQETRLLFQGLCVLNSVEIEGFLQTSLRFLTVGMREKRSADIPKQSQQTESARFHRYSRLILSLDSKPSKKTFDVIDLYLKRRREAWTLALTSLLTPGLHKIKTSTFEPQGFEEFIWQSLFIKTLLAADYALVTTRSFKVCSVPWNVMQSAGLNTLKFVSKALYPRLDTRDVDIFIAQTPYPGRVDKNTVLVVRYHDALPILMPNAFANKSRHQATHFYALRSNVEAGAYFACVSDATRLDLLRIFPEIGDRAVTIHNIVSPHYFEENSSPAQVAEIVRARLNLQAPSAHPEFHSLVEQEQFYQLHLHTQAFPYLLMVSTIEPRKNHTRLIAAWMTLRTHGTPNIKLVIVGGLGWDIDPIMQEMRTWIDRGLLFVLSNVPAAELRVLYHHAAATVCPSLAEGFDFSGVEAMCSGGVTIASDIAVHREVYADAAEYFDPHSTDALVDAIQRAFSPSRSDNLRILGKKVAAQYASEKIIPQWDDFLRRVVYEKNLRNYS